MVNDPDHIKYILKKSDATRKKFEIQMLGQGLFSDFDNKDKKIVAKKVGK